MPVRRATSMSPHCASLPRRRCMKHLRVSSSRSSAPSPGATTLKRSRVSRPCAPLSTAFSTTSWSMPKTWYCAAIAWHCWRSCDTTLHGSRTCPACRVDDERLKHADARVADLQRVPVPVDAGIRIQLLRDHPVPVVPRPLLVGRSDDARSVLRRADFVRHPLHRRGPRESPPWQSRHFHEALFDLGDLR